MNIYAHRLSLAPMLDMTDRHFRALCRLMCKEMLLYTELTTTGAIINGKNDYLTYNESEHPVSLQLGGANPKDLAICAKKAQEYGYDEINLNVGCPSDRVQNGSFGAILMRTPNLVCDLVKALKDAVTIPVTVKTRLGVDELDSYEYIYNFLSNLVDSGVDEVALHARMAFLKTMTPKENRDKPPLNYDRVYSLKKDFKNLPISINGNITTLEQAKEHLKYVDGVMIGRSIYHNPYMLIDADELIFDKPHKEDKPKRKEIIRSFYPYIEEHLKKGGELKHISRHLLGMFTNIANSRSYRQYIAQNHYKKGANIDVLETAMSFIDNNEPITKSLSNNNHL